VLLILLLEAQAELMMVVGMVVTLHKVAAAVLAVTQVMAVVA
jgi:hypothetical protein